MKTVIFDSLVDCIFVNIKHLFILTYVPQLDIGCYSRYRTLATASDDLIRPNVQKSFGMKLIETPIVEVIPNVQTSD